MKKNHLFSLTKGLVLLTMILSISLTSCKKDDEDEAESFEHPELLGEYTGSFEHNDFSSESYTFTVTGVNANTVKITPEDSNGVEFEVSLTELNGMYVNANNSLGNTTFAISPIDSDDIWQLTFNRTNEGIFAGYKQ
jgi:hypothetical protein